MKYSLVALAATSIFGGVSARSHFHNRRHNHPVLSDYGTATCIPQCTTYVTSYLVDYTPPPAPPAPPKPSTISVVPVPEHTAPAEHTLTTTVKEEVTSFTTTGVTATSYVPTATPEITTCPTPGTYTIPAKTITLTSTDYICAPSTTQLPPGTHTVGGVTTVVTTQTTVTCPVPIIETTGDVTTSKVVMTTYVCPTPGTYTIGPITTTITATTVVPCEIPTVTSYPPGTYTAPEVVTTITKTNEVVTCPPYTSTSSVTVVPVAPTEVPEAPATTKSPEIKVTPPSYPSNVPEVSSKVPEVPEVPEVTTTTKAPETSQTATPEKPKDDDKPVYVPHENMWAITYSPYNDDGTCKAAGDVDADVKDIASKGFKALRLYATDCNGLETVGGACEKHGLKIVLGVFIKAGGVRTADSQVEEIIKWNKWNMVEMFVVGNEAVFQGFCSAADLGSYISEVKGKIREAGYNGPVTTTEPLGTYEQNENYKAICPHMDVVGINIHPFFNAQTTADKAGTFLASQLKIIEDLCQLPGYVLEAGWPSAGQPNGMAIPGPSEQAVAIKAIEEAEPGKVVIFTYRNDYWKNPGAYGVEQNFGCGDLF